jgi:hypothetical protein
MWFPFLLEGYGPSFPLSAKILLHATEDKLLRCAALISLISLGQRLISMILQFPKTSNGQLRASKLNKVLQLN